MEESRIILFTDLIAWQNSHSLSLSIYRITESFPHHELFSLTNQMRRCSISITSNIAEGFSRKGKKEKQKFYFIALGSITELQNQLMLARDLGYIDLSKFNQVYQLTITSHKLVNGLIKSAEQRS